MPVGNDFLVYVRCFTYNHSLFIRECLDGFCMQQTSFHYVCAVVDDASTDGEQEIIKSYLQDHFDLSDEGISRIEDTDDYQLIFARHKTNPNCHFAVYFLKYNHYSIKKSKLPYLQVWNSIKYCAICEGDDFWISPHKLQRQVDFLLSHPKHSLCFHAHYSLKTDGSKKPHVTYQADVEECPIKDLILGGGGFMATNSMLYIGALGNDYRVWAKSSDVGDGPLMMTLAARGQVGYINEIMSCYRVATEGSWTQRVLHDKKKNKEHHKRTLRSWREFDEWTDYKYHRYVKRKIFKNIYHYWLKRNSIIKSCISKFKKFRNKWI